MKTPYESIYGHKPSVNHFIVFCCPCTLLHLESNPKFNAKADDCYFVGYTACTAYMVYNKKMKQIVESFDVRWLEKIETDVRVGPDWLFDYTSLFKSFNVSSDNQAGSTSSSKIIIEDEEEEVVYIPLLVTSDPPAVSSVQTDSSESSRQQPSPDADTTPLILVEREFMNQETSAVTSNLMELLFPERIGNEFVADPTNEPSSSTMDHSANEGVVNIHNLPVSIDDLCHTPKPKAETFRGGGDFMLSITTN
ncbi:hypothetical protein Lser_V15G20820 [Lactuca serriola]